MEPNDKDLIAVFNEVIASLKNEIRVKDELIQKQEKMIAILQENNTLLEKLLQDILPPERG